MAQIGTITRFVQNPTANVTNGAWVETSFTVPPHGLIKRIRVQEVAGPATLVEAELRRVTGGTGLDVICAFALVAEIDRGGPGDEISVPYLVAALPTAAATAGLPEGNLIVALQSNNAGSTTYRIEVCIEAR